MFENFIKITSSSSSSCAVSTDIPLSSPLPIVHRFRQVLRATPRFLTELLYVGRPADKMKHSFFQAAIVTILLYGCTTWTLTKRQEKRLDGNYTRMLRAILNKSWRQHPTQQQLYGHQPPITKTIQIRQTRHAEHFWRSRDELISDVLLWTPTHAEQKQDD